MRIITMLCAVVASALLFGCVSVPKDPKLIIGSAPPDSTIFNTVRCAIEGDCTVKIEVAGDCKFNVPTLVVLSGIAGRRHAVVWRILSSDYVFSTTPGTPALIPKGSQDFFRAPAVIGPIMAVEVTITTPGLSHEYGLNIVKRAGGACPSVDPYVIE